jgi:hypothetical protein
VGITATRDGLVEPAEYTLRVVGQNVEFPRSTGAQICEATHTESPEDVSDIGTPTTRA